MSSFSACCGSRAMRKYREENMKNIYSTDSGSYKETVKKAYHLIFSLRRGKACVKINKLKRRKLYGRKA